MQPVGANDKIEATRLRMLEGDLDAVPILSKPFEIITEKDFRGGFSAFKQQTGKVAATDGDETTSGQLPEHARAEPRQSSALVVDNSQLPDVVAQEVEVAG